MFLRDNASDQPLLTPEERRVHAVGRALVFFAQSGSASYFTRVYVRSRSFSHDTPSFDNSPLPMMVWPLSTIVSVLRCEKPGALRHHFKTLSCRLTSCRLETPRSSK